MSNSNISALTSATTPLAGTEVLPVVQNGATKQVSVANLTAGRAVSAASLALTTALPTTSGGTGLNSFAANGIVYASSTSALATSSSFTYTGTNLLLSGSLGIGSSSLTDTTVRIGKSLTGATTYNGFLQNGTVQSDVTVAAYSYKSNTQTAAAAFTLTSYYHYGISQSALGAGSAITNQYGFSVESSMVGATNNYGFYGNLATAANRYNIYMNGTAPNWFSGNVLIFGAGGLGYTTGSGGAVTQLTSRTTGVTLNKTNGAITLFTAAGSVVAATFTVTNSTVAATDTIILNQKSGTNLYILLVTAVAAGSFNITFYTTGGIASDTPVINFSVIKAVTA